MLRLPNTSYWLTNLQVIAQSVPAFKLPLSLHSSQCEEFVEFLDIPWCPARAPKSSLPEQPQIPGRVGINPWQNKQMPLVPGLWVKPLALRCEESADCHNYPWKKLVYIQVPKDRANLVFCIFQHPQSRRYKNTTPSEEVSIHFTPALSTPSPPVLIAIKCFWNQWTPTYLKSLLLNVKMTIRFMMIPPWDYKFLCPYSS